jgi:hypothetical protein
MSDLHNRKLRLIELQVMEQLPNANAIIDLEKCMEDILRVLPIPQILNSA